MTSRGCFRWRSSCRAAPSRAAAGTRAPLSPARAGPRGDRGRGGSARGLSRSPRAPRLLDDALRGHAGRAQRPRRLTFRRQDWSDAAAAYQSVLADPDGAGARRAGRRLREARHRPAARRRAGGGARAAGEDPGARSAPHPGAWSRWSRRRALPATTTRSCATRRRCWRSPTIRRTKLGLLEYVATIHSERRNDPQRAIGAYLEALKIWPDERSIMHRLLGLYTDTKQWKQSVQLLARLATLADDATRAPYFVAAGNILAEELHARAEAIEAFEQALDADPYDFKTFERDRPAGDGGARLEDGGAHLSAPDQTPRRPSCRRTNVRRSSLCGTASVRSTGRASRTARAPSPRSRSPRASIPRESSAAGRWLSSIASPGWRPIPRRSLSTRPSSRAPRLPPRWSPI